MPFNGNLFSIMPIANIPSVLEHGILSNVLAGQLSGAVSVALPVVQDRRDRIEVPGGLHLHKYANLYFDPRNPMICSLREKRQQLCVLVISEGVLKLPDVVLTDRNAASEVVRFLEVSQIDEIDFVKVYARDWRHPGDRGAYWNHKAIKNAEVLIPNLVSPEYILAAHVVNRVAEENLRHCGFVRDIMISPDMFFDTI